MANIYCWSGGYTAVTQWAASTAVTVGTIRRQLATPTAGNERCFRCSVAGTTGSTEPTWVITANGSTTDGTVTWIECTGQAAYNGNGGGSAWGAPHARLAVALNFSAAGDTIYLASAHAETGTYTNAFSIPGTATARTRILSIDEAVVPATNLTTLKAGASCTNSNGASSITGTSSTSGYCYIYGLTMIQSAGSSAILGLGTGNSHLIADTCKFQVTSTATGTSGIYIGLAGATTTSTNRVRLKDCSIRFGNVAQTLNLRGADVKISNLSIDGAGSIPTTLFTVPAANTGINTTVIDSDLSNITGTLFNLGNANNNFASLNLQNCKLASGVTLPTTVSRPGYQFRMDNCDSGATNYRFYLVNAFGFVQQDTTTVITTPAAGVADAGVSGITRISAKVDSNANATWESPLELSLSPIWVIAGTPVTWRYEIASGLSLTNAQVWVDVEYPGSASSPLINMATSGTGSITASGSTLDTSTALWGGSQSSKQYFTVTFTPAASGWALPVLKVARPSTTVYLDMGGVTVLPGAGLSMNGGTIATSGLLIHPGMAGGMRG